MDEQHRNIISNNIAELIRLTEYELLMNRCLANGLLFDVMKNEIEKKPFNVNVKHKLLFEKVTKRGPKAFNTLVSICRQDFPQAANILKPMSSYGYTEIALHKKNKPAESNVNDGIITSSHEEYKDITDSRSSENNNTPEQFSLKLFTDDVTPRIRINVIQSTEIHSHPKLDKYLMQSKHRGVFFLVNIIKFPDVKDFRNGAGVDKANLIALFRGMQFDIFYYEDLTTNQFDTLLNELTQSHYLRRTECLVFALLTHGSLKMNKLMVQFTNGSVCDIEYILGKFDNNNCPHLVGKPKVFLLPFCKGQNRDTGVPSLTTQQDGMNLNNAETIRYPTMSDMKLCYATVPGYVTFRESNSGSWYIEIMCQIWAEHAHDTSLDVLLKMVGEKTGQRRTDSGEMQTASTEDRGFNKELYFNPGYYKT